MGKYLEIKVYHGNIEKAIKILKKKVQNDGLFKKLKEKRFYEKPSVKKKRKHKEALKRLKKKDNKNKSSKGKK
jgi:small subunit ribosomal protein S21